METVHINIFDIWQISNLFHFVLSCIRQPVLDKGLPYFPMPVLLKANKLACN